MFAISRTYFNILIPKNKQHRIKFVKLYISRYISNDIKEKVILHSYDKKKYEQNEKLSEECKKHIDIKNKIFYDFLVDEENPIYEKNSNNGRNIFSTIIQKKRNGNDKTKERENPSINEVSKDKKQKQQEKNLTEHISVSYLSEYRKLKKAVRKKRNYNYKELYIDNAEFHDINETDKIYNETENEVKELKEREKRKQCFDNNTYNHTISDDLKNIYIDNSEQFHAYIEKKEIKQNMKLNQCCSYLGYCSSRFAFQNLKNGIVSVNHEIVYENIDVDLNKDKVELTKRGKELVKNKITILINKPPNYLSISTDIKLNKNILARNLIINENKFIEEEHKCMSYFIYRNVNIEKVNNLYVCGRLDKNSSGLLIYTQNTLIHNYLLNKYKYQIEKEYIITTYHPITENNLYLLKQNLCIEGKFIYKCHIKYINEYTLHFIIYQGFYKIIRKMALASNIKIKSLHRIRIGNIQLKNLPLGKWRFLMPNESFI